MHIDDFKAPYLPVSDNQRIAALCREALNPFFLTNTLDVPGLFVAASKLLGRRIGCIIQPDDQMGRANAFVAADGNTVFVRQTMVGLAAQGCAVSIFTAVHELAHLILHRDVNVPLARMIGGNAQHKYLSPEESAECQADVFTRGFLITDDEVRRYQTADRLEENCFVPLEHAKLRLGEYSRARRIRPSESVLGFQKKLLWEALPTIESLPPSQSRLCGIYRIEWQEFSMTTQCGWYIVENEIRASFPSMIARP